jgi:hypothetical protein
MKKTRPTASAELMPQNRPFVSEIPRLRKQAQREGLSGLASDTKWDELLSEMRDRDESWTPSFRFLCIDADRPSGWDGEWWHHLPFPFISVRWFDLTYHEKIHRGYILAPQIVDHSPWITKRLTDIGLDYEKGPEAIRIFGYSPRDYTDFKKTPNQSLQTTIMAVTDAAAQPPRQP